MRIREVSNLRELLRCVFYNAPSRFVEPAELLIEEIIKEGGCITYNIYDIANKILRRRSDIEYVIKRMVQLGMLEIKEDKLCISNKFSKRLESILNMWNEVLKYVEESRIKRILS